MVPRYVLVLKGSISQSQDPSFPIFVGTEEEFEAALQQEGGQLVQSHARVVNHLKGITGFCGCSLDKRVILDDGIVLTTLDM